MVCEFRSLGFVTADDGHEMYAAFPSALIHHRPVTSPDLFIQYKVLHLCSDENMDIKAHASFEIQFLDA